MKKLLKIKFITLSVTAEWYANVVIVFFISKLFQVLEYTGRCVAVSEPDSPNFLAMKFRKEGDSPELRQLARDVIRWECRPYPSMQPPPLAYACTLKLTAPAAVVQDTGTLREVPSTSHFRLSPQF
jgi:hypothetical protein